MGEPASCRIRRGLGTMPISPNAEPHRPAGLEEDAPKFSVPWRVVGLHILPNFRFEVTFADGASGTVDVSNLVHANDAGVFAALRDADIFAQAYLDYGAVPDRKSPRLNSSP